METGENHSSTPILLNKLGAANGLSTATQIASATVVKSKLALTGGIRRKLRKSCEFCRERKKRCDGDGVNRCSLCIVKGQSECRYNERLPNASRSSCSGGQASAALRAGAAGALEHAGARGAVDGCGPDVGSESAGVATSSAVVRNGFFVPGGAGTLKRCRFGPSPATGLVGMQENQFLSDYFDCMGFLPLASESNIRQALVSLMLASLSPAQREVEDESFVGEKFVHKRRGVMDESGAIIAAERRKSRFPSTDASTCALWCAIGIGALVRGSPPKTVEGYAQLARESLTGCFDEVSPETARAFILMAFLHNFLGDEAKFKKFLVFAHGTVAALSPGDIHQSFLDVLNVADSARLYSGVAPSKAEVEAFIRQHVPARKTGGIFRQKDLCCLFLQTDHRLDQAFFRDLWELGMLDDTARDGEEPRRDVPPVSLAMEVEPTPVRDDDKDGQQASPDEVLEEDGEVASEDVQGSVLGKGAGHAISSRMLSLEALPEYQRLLDVATWPEIRGGVGGLMFNGTMAYLSGFGSDVQESLKGVVRFSQVILVYPGLCRFSIWRHHTHCALSTLAKTGSCEMYQKLRVAYNAVQPPHLPMVPPMEEWDMKHVCRHVFCRSIFDILCGPKQCKVPQLFGTLAVSISNDAESDTSSRVGEPSTETDSKLDPSSVQPTLSLHIPHVATSGEAVESCDGASNASGVSVALPRGGIGQGQEQGSKELEATLLEPVVHEGKPKDAVAAACSWDGGRDGVFGYGENVIDVGSMMMADDEPLVYAGSTGQGPTGDPDNPLRTTSDDALLRELLLDGLGTVSES